MYHQQSNTMASEMHNLWEMLNTAVASVKHLLLYHLSYRIASLKKGGGEFRILI